MKIWVRPVTVDDSKCCLTLAAVALLLGPLGIGTINGYGRLHIEGDGFKGLYNCICVYWADEEGLPLRGLTNDEITEVNRELDRYFQVGDFATTSSY